MKSFWMIPTWLQEFEKEAGYTVTSKMSKIGRIIYTGYKSFLWFWGLLKGTHNMRALLQTPRAIRQRKQKQASYPLIRKKKRAYQRQYVQDIKRKILTHYGNGECACVRCGCADIRALCLDHINGGAAALRREIGEKLGHHFYLWIIRQDYPKGYQTLCMNCNQIKRVTEDDDRRRLD